MTKRSHDQWTRREREIMNAVFALGNRTTAEAVRARLVDPPSSSSVRVMLARLEAKGYLRHEEDGIRYVYVATTSPASAKRAALRQHLDVFFGGSWRLMATALVRDGSWSDEDLDVLREEIERARK